MTTHLKLIYKTNLNQSLKQIHFVKSYLFCDKHIQDEMNQTNKNSSPGSDRVTSELVINGGKYLVAALNILLQASYQLGYFLKRWKNKKESI